MCSKKKIKILVCYHKKSKLLKDEVLIPINAGRSIAEKKYKDGDMSEHEYEWLVRNLLPDNIGDNISDFNSTINEMTALYWAWKNYDKIGNPDYLGLYHYRRVLNIKNSELQRILKKYYFIQRAPEKIVEGRNLYEQWRNLSFDWADNDYLEMVLGACKSYDSDLGQDIEAFFKTEREVCWCNMFILPKEEFFRYCEFIFPLVFYLNKTLPQREDRALGMFCERLTAYYLYKLSKREKGYNAKAKMIKEDNISFLQRIFSVKNEGFHKVIRFLGIKLKLKRHCENIKCGRYRIQGNNNKIIIIHHGVERVLSKYEIIKGLDIIISGNNNIIKVLSSDIGNSTISLNSSDSKIFIGENCWIRGLHVYTMLGNGQQLVMGDNSSTCGVNVHLKEADTSVFIGVDCQFSDEINIWPTDGHAIFDKKSMHLLNKPKTIIIGDHCWIATGVHFTKNAKLPNNTIVGAKSVVTKSFTKENTTLAGNPAKIISTGVEWDRMTPSQVIHIKEHEGLPV